MTVGGWIIFAVIALAFFVSGIAVAIAFWKQNKAISCISVLLAAALTAGLLFGMRWYYGSTAAGQRAFKSQESNFNNGINRKVEVYDATGNLIKEYAGKFDIDYDDDRIIFDDENGKRHVIYYPTGTVIIDEID